MFTPAYLLALFPAIALAQNYGPPQGGSSPTPSSSSAPAAASAPADSQGQHNINVGLNGLTFEPANITAQVGDLVTFYFASAGLQHSVTQSTFADPCTPLTSNGTGFDSGLTQGTQFTINITDASKPIWFFCKFPAHCSAGMVGSINAPSSGNTFDTFQSKAKSLGSSAPTISDSGAVTGGVGAVATAGPSTSGGSAAPSPTSNNSGSVRVVVNGGLALAAVAAAVAFAA